MPLPQFGYDRPERVCERCMEVAFYVSYVLAESPATQVAGVRRLADVAKRNGAFFPSFLCQGVTAHTDAGCRLQTLACTS